MLVAWAVGIVAVGALSAGGSDGVGAESSTAAAPGEVGAAPGEVGAAPGEVWAALGEVDSGQRAAQPLWPGIGHRIARVRAGKAVAVRAEPGGPLVKRLDARTAFGSPRVFSVLKRRGGWVAVATPATGDNTPGWVRVDTRKLRLGRVPDSIVVDLEDGRVRLRRHGRATRTFPVTIGAAGTSTPPGRFAVTDVITKGLNPVYGCCAVALSAHQPNLPPGWIGGDRVAIHGWTGPVGGSASGGCLRAGNDDMEKLIQSLPLGTPVTIRT